jgi:hypothetical protein
MWKNMVEADRQRWRCNRCMCFVCWIAQATDTHPEYAIFIAFPRQQWLCECTTVLCAYVHFLSFSICFCCTRVIQKLFEGQCNVYIPKGFLVGATGLLVPICKQNYQSSSLYIIIWGWKGVSGFCFLHTFFCNLVCHLYDTLQLSPLLCCVLHAYHIILPCICSSNEI